ncbi:MAG: glucosamine kinase [Lentimonas sp.]|jgi:glucosamine kinase
MRAYLGIDGGGTRTRSLLVSETGDILGRAVAGPSNVQQVSIDTLRGNLQVLLDQTFTDLPDDIEYISSCFGLAGAESAQNKDEIRDILVSLTPVPSEQPILTSDAHIALIGALANRPGLMLIAGTGSICLGRDTDGHTHRTGGWGPAYDDLGSGSWIGKQAMQMTFQESDGRRPTGPWQRNVLKRLRCASIEELLCKVKTGEIINPHVAALAPMVIQLAQAGVSAADDIINRGVEELIRAVIVTHRKSKLGDTPLVLVGGVLEKSGFFRERLTTALNATEPKIKIQKSLMSPIVGAVVVACKKSNDGLPKELEKALTAELVG